MSEFAPHEQLTRINHINPSPVHVKHPQKPIYFSWMKPHIWDLLGPGRVYYEDGIIPPMIADVLPINILIISPLYPHN